MIFPIIGDRGCLAAEAEVAAAAVAVAEESGGEGFGELVARGFGGGGG